MSVTPHIFPFNLFFSLTLKLQISGLYNTVSTTILSNITLHIYTPRPNYPNPTHIIKNTNFKNCFNKITYYIKLQLLYFKIKILVNHEENKANKSIWTSATKLKSCFGWTKRLIIWKWQFRNQCIITMFTLMMWRHSIKPAISVGWDFIKPG